MSVEILQQAIRRCKTPLALGLRAEKSALSPALLRQFTEMYGEGPLATTEALRYHGCRALEQVAGILPAVILVASIAVKLYMGFYNRGVGKKIDSLSLKATAVDSFSDSIATTVVLISMVISHASGYNIDGWAGLAVAVFILFAGYNALKDTLSPLLGQAPDPDTIHRIEEIVLSYPDVVGIHDIVVHDYGPGRLMVSLHAEVRGDGDIFALHDAVDSAETQVLKELGCLSVTTPSAMCPIMSLASIPSPTIMPTWSAPSRSSTMVWATSCCAAIRLPVTS